MCYSQGSTPSSGIVALNRYEIGFQFLNASCLDCHCVSCVLASVYIHTHIGVMASHAWDLRAIQSCPQLLSLPLTPSSSLLLTGTGKAFVDCVCVFVALLCFIHDFFTRRLFVSARICRVVWPPLVPRVVLVQGPAHNSSKALISDTRRQRTAYVAWTAWGRIWIVC